jgi:predicted helicase
MTVQNQFDYIAGNPPYNAGQLNENDNNKNRRYLLGVDKRISENSEFSARHLLASGSPFSLTSFCLAA